MAQDHARATDTLTAGLVSESSAPDNPCTSCGRETVRHNRTGYRICTFESCRALLYCGVTEDQLESLVGKAARADQLQTKLRQLMNLHQKFVEDSAKLIGS